MRIQTALVAILLSASSIAYAETELSVDWEWKLSHGCRPISPALTIAGIPSDTKSLSFTMVDLDFTSFNHGGGNLAHDGGATIVVPEGALKDYRGPCPGTVFNSFGHDYAFTVRALAADGKTELARGRKTKTFSASSVKQ